MNILFTSAGRRGYIISYFKEALKGNGEIHVSNSNPICPSFAYADKTLITPLIYADNYVPFLLAYCKEKSIDAIIPLFDVDLPILAENKYKFEEANIKVIISNKKIIDICNDKWQTYGFLIKHNLPTPKTYLSLEESLTDIDRDILKFPLIIKPRFGMGSIGIYEAENKEELKVINNIVTRFIKQSYLKYESLKGTDHITIIQEKLNGQEYGLDIINNLDGVYQNTIVKKKYTMRAGETDCAKTIRDAQLSKFGEKLSQLLRHVCNMDVDIIKNNKKVYVLDLNARFGGGYPFSHIAGVDLPLAILNWIDNKQPSKELLDYKTGILSHKDINIITLVDN